MGIFFAARIEERGRENTCFPVEEGRAKPVGKPWVSEEEECRAHTSHKEAKK
ncbi:MAG: hypothetical protein UW27_C0017G0108 [Parcubacteria group bacterium GW2011_GWA1_44_13]|uniref:Uncharacterized protein n=1 Tax=Candidatus Nomurabacteria bacterium GW2011_GWB1_44_12 TaxID=1618748 RepID=A0A837I9F1_9BACT|nr:MAG: hypothetical protein UW25_C0004G0061 [Candidatus Nomurabacteria bacterium GW2011_GWB1_44_12]KKT37491.1 MAG: hypothetical protein UW27_C0017G0108 [Parcubacteria group bacterium GW2011_GWA1_44_13]